MTVTSVGSNVLRGLLRVTAEDDVRYYLNGIGFDLAKGQIAATDGHCLVVIKTPVVEGAEPFILPRKLVSIVLDIASETSPCQIEVKRTDDGKYQNVVVTRNGYAVSCHALDGKFPEYGKAVPRDPSGEAGNYNPRLLRKVQGALNELCGLKESDQFDLIQNGKEKAALLIGLNSDCFGVVMPLRSNRDRSRAMQIVYDLGFPVEAQLPAAPEAVSA